MTFLSASAIRIAKVLKKCLNIPVTAIFVASSFRTICIVLYVLIGVLFIYLDNGCKSEISLRILTVTKTLPVVLLIPIALMTADRPYSYESKLLIISIIPAATGDIVLKAFAGFIPVPRLLIMGGSCFLVFHLILCVVWHRRAQRFNWSTLPAHLVMIILVPTILVRASPHMREPLSIPSIVIATVYFVLLNVQTFLAASHPKPEYTTKVNRTQPWLFPSLAGWMLLFSDVIVATVDFLFRGGMVRGVMVMGPYYGGLALIVASLVFFPTADHSLSPVVKERMEEMREDEGGEAKMKIE